MGLISFFQQFFRHQPDGAISMATFDQTHLMLLALTTLGCMFIISDYYLIFKQEKFKKILAYTLLAQQAIMYAWHFSAGQHFDLAEALPLYNCRIAIFLCDYRSAYQQQNRSSDYNLLGDFRWNHRTTHHQPWPVPIPALGLCFVFRRAYRVIVDSGLFCQNQPTPQSWFAPPYRHYH